MKIVQVLSFYIAIMIFSVPLSAENTRFVTNSAASKEEISAANITYTKMYDRLQFLQDEVFRLQGSIEQLQHEMEKMKKERVQDAIDIDKRLSAMDKKLVSIQGVPQGQTSVQKSSIKQTPTISGGNYAVYKQAYALVKERKFDQAEKAFNDFIKQYPDSKLVGNAYYWLGEIYILKKDYQKAEAAFKIIIADYPGHNKVPEAMYKLGRVYFDTGNKVASKKQMELVLATNKSKSNNAVKLASEFLKAHF